MSVTTTLMVLHVVKENELLFCFVLLGWRVGVDVVLSGCEHFHLLCLLEIRRLRRFSLKNTNIFEVPVGVLRS